MTDPRALARSLANRDPEREPLNRGLGLLRTRLKELQIENATSGEIWSPLPAEVTDRQQKRFLKAFSSIHALDLAWLARVAHPGIGHEVVTLRLLRIYCSSIPFLTSGMHPAALSVRDPCFFEERNHSQRAIETSICLLTLMHHPLTFLPEILGVTLAFLGRALKEDQLNPRLEANRVLGAQARKDASKAGFDDQRIAKGYLLYRNAASSIGESSVHEDLTWNRRSAFARVIRNKSPAARGYHGKIRIGEVPLEQWLNEIAHGDPAKLLCAMETESQREPGCPISQRLIKAMKFGGPMFGVFDDQEISLAERWLEAPDAPEEAPEADWPEPSEDPYTPDNGTPASPKRRESLRSIYTRLLATDARQDIPGSCRKLLNITFLGARILMALRPFKGPKVYDTEAFKTYIHHLHQQALLAPRPSLGAYLDLADWRYVLLQITPSVLVDGCWLSETGHIPGLLESWHQDLISILEDELGRGEPERNHPNIQRLLIQSLGDELPDFRSPDFSSDPRFRDSAFVFPCILLSIAREPVRFEPEILGLNLAIELSGLGQGYPAVIDALKSHGIDPLIVQLHLSIDNIGSGHAHRAVQAIARYLDTLRLRSGKREIKNAYRRILLGYLSYRVANFPFAIDLFLRLISKKLGILRSS